MNFIPELLLGKRGGRGQGVGQGQAVPQEGDAAGGAPAWPVALGWKSGLGFTLHPGRREVSAQLGEQLPVDRGRPGTDG